MAKIERTNPVAERMREASTQPKLYLEDARALLADAAREIERLQELAADMDEFNRENMPELYSDNTGQVAGVVYGGMTQYNGHVAGDAVVNWDRRR